MDVSLVLPPEPDERWDLAKQVGVTSAVVHTLEIGDGSRPSAYETLSRWTERFADAGIDVAVLEGGVPLTDTTRLGRPGRDEEIEEFCTLLRNLGELGVPVVCYDWMAGIRWARTDTAVPARGGSLTTAYDDEAMRERPAPDVPDIAREELWANLEYFLERVVPVAEEAGVKLGLHPDDPPREDVHGVPRIVNSVEAYDRVLEIVDSEHNGVTFCQGNFAAMGVDIPETIRHFGDRINFVHFRDVDGDADAFVETWHDAGSTDMRAAMAAYRDIGFDGPIRPDHVPTMAGEENDNPGYETKGRLFAVGYMRGLLDGIDGAE
ncbi:mannonate dehydratase [Haloterrigena alkaliphila]|uniref:mannonate dehydratase n=1 Tax=Haloterrigena alkaliphila TaxID=2816475 RepID=A0A8A2VBH4_9EURY|nr:mannonate dehydratase [Haloterrigena alkaliphila]QSW99409.1 mannonate dehydratase [Haloterrigena alkaliphila]